MNSPVSFKERHPEFQQLVRELELLRNHNLTFNKGDSQEKYLLLSEAAVVCMTLERFLRAILSDSSSSDTLYNLLDRALSRDLIRFDYDDREDALRKITGVRNTILHGDYEKAAAQSKRPSVQAYLLEQLAAEVEWMYQFTDSLVRQIDPETGLSRHTPRPAVKKKGKQAAQQKPRKR